MDNQRPKGNATVVDDQALTPDQRRAMDCIADMLKGDRNAAAVFVLKLHKDGSVANMGGSSILNPPDLAQLFSNHLANVLRDLAIGVKQESERCNCPRCIAERGGVFMNPAIKAEA